MHVKSPRRPRPLRNPPLLKLRLLLKLRPLLKLRRLLKVRPPNAATAGVTAIAAAAVRRTD